MRGALLKLILFAAAAMCTASMAHAQAENERTFLLVAKPGMLDPNFDKTVVLAVRPDDGGPIGVILNRPTTVRLRELLPDRADLGNRNDVVFLGGPIEPEALLFAFHSSAKPAKALLVADDVYISGFSEVLTEMLKHPEQAARQRFFTGFSGWAGGQLEDEIAQGGWYVLRYDAGALFDMNPLTMYDEMLKRAVVPRIEASRDLRLPGAIPR
jgi:putative transcriptional regulator